MQEWLRYVEILLPAQSVASAQEIENQWHLLNIHELFKAQGEDYVNAVLLRIPPETTGESGDLGTD